MLNNKLIEYSCPFCKKNNKEVLYQYDICTKTLGDTSVTLVICLSCYFVFNSPRPSLEEINKHYQEDSSGAVYRENLEGSRSFTLDLERSEFIEKNCSNLEKGNFLDVGCGQGSLLKKLKIPQLKKFGLDPIQNTSNDPNDSIVFINGFIETYKVDADKKYDVITCISSLEHYYNPDIVFNKLKKLLVFNGILILEIPDTLNPKAQLAEFFSFEHLSHFTKKSLTRTLNFYGFEVIEFDKNVSIPNIRVVAKKIKNTVYKKAQKSEKSLIKDTINTYIKTKKLEIDRLSSVINPIIDDCKMNKKKVLIYGAGDHTIHLFLHFELENYVSSYIDSDPKKWGKKFRGKKILKPSDIKYETLVNIIISSHDYEAEILNTININNLNQLGVTCLYNK
jgi:2-polyprenyl-3-methyl-5-hydroxy-6-metoxy-1,4-benzoquinol methylase